MSFIFLADELTMGLGVDVVLDDDDDLSEGATGIVGVPEPVFGVAKVVSLNLVLVVFGEQFTRPINAALIPSKYNILLFMYQNLELRYTICINWHAVQEIVLSKRKWPNVNAHRPDHE